MATHRDREDQRHSLSFTNPSSSSTPITVSGHLDAFLTDPSRSAPGSFQNEDFLLDAAPIDVEFGFSRPDFRQSELVGTVRFYERHVFLCYKNPQVWPSRIEATEFDRLPRLLSAAVNSRKNDMKKVTRLTICEGHDGTETSNGDVLIFPDMIRYRRLTHFDVDTFVEEVLVKEGEWLPGNPETLNGSFVFVCCHGSRDRHCGICGPALISRFKEEIGAHRLQGKVSVSPCSHIGGDKYAGNVIIFGSNSLGEVAGHWYGYVSPDDVPALLEHHVVQGAILHWLWRGQMGLSEEEQKLRLQLDVEANGEKSNIEWKQTQRSKTNLLMSRSEAKTVACCQEKGISSCCQKSVTPEKVENPDANGTVAKMTTDRKSSSRAFSRINSGKGPHNRKICTMPTWLESWEREDTYAALAVLCAVASVAVAYSCYRQL